MADTPEIPAINLLTIEGAKEAGEDLAEEINLLSDPQISGISSNTRNELKKLFPNLSSSNNIIRTDTEKRRAVDLFSFATILQRSGNLDDDTRADIHDNILSRISHTTKKNDQQFSIHESLEQIKKGLMAKEIAAKEKAEKNAHEAKEKAENHAKEVKENAEKDAKFKALPFSDRLTSKPLDTIQKTLSENRLTAITVGGGTVVVGAINLAFPAVLQTFLTNFPIVLDYTHALTTAAHTISQTVGLNAITIAGLPGLGAAISGILALPALGYARRKVLESTGHTMPKYTNNISALIGNTGHGLRLITIDAALAPLRIARFGLQKIAKSKILKPTKLGVGAAAVGVAAAPFTGGTSLTLGSLGYIVGNALSHGTKAKDEHAGHGNTHGSGHQDAGHGSAHHT